jgi:hypothetical protein
MIPGKLNSGATGEKARAVHNLPTGSLWENFHLFHLATSRRGHPEPGFQAQYSAVTGFGVALPSKVRGGEG